MDPFPRARELGVCLYETESVSLSRASVQVKRGPKARALDIREMQVLPHGTIPLGQGSLESVLIPPPAPPLSCWGPRACCRGPINPQQQQQVWGEKAGELVPINSFFSLFSSFQGN